MCVGEQKQNMSIHAVSKLLPVVQLRENDTETWMKTSLSMCLRINVSGFFYRKLAFNPHPHVGVYYFTFVWVSVHMYEQTRSTFGESISTIIETG